MAAARFVVRGHVQGVGFRWYVWRHAGRLGLRGFARNLADGSVEVVAAGPASALAELERLLARGPALARVADVEKTEIPHEEALPKAFEIR
jgi:acylphosphatase